MTDRFNSPHTQGGNRIRVMDVPLDRIDLDQTMEQVKRACEDRSTLHIITVNTDFLRLAGLDPSLVQIANEAGLTVTDGKLLVWLTHFLGPGVPEQITGHDLVRECAALAARAKLGVLLLGAAPGVAERAADRLRRDYPDLKVTGLHGGEFTNSGVLIQPNELERRIRALNPSFLFVALGCPKQDHWIAQNLKGLDVPVGVGVGSVLDVLAGDLPRAPRWMQRSGLESVFQLFAAPRRYFRRYVLQDPPIVARIVLSALIKRR